jgi:hypothetical protein
VSSRDEPTIFFYPGGGLAVGMVFSVALFRRRTWPAVFGAGLGTGIAYGNCQNSLNQPFMVHAHRVKMAVSFIDPAFIHQFIPLPTFTPYSYYSSGINSLPL